MSDMDKSCFTCSKFPNCIYLVDTYDEEENDDDRMSYLTLFGKNCTYYQEST